MLNYCVMTIKEYYEDYKLRINFILDSSLGEEELANIVALSFHFVDDYSVWLESIGNRLETVMYYNAIKVYQDSLGCMLVGQYQSAFMGLRYCFERTLCGVYLSANELELRTWLNGRRDTYWTELVGKEGKEIEGNVMTDDNYVDKGLFSTKYVNAFFPELQDEVKHFRRMAVSVYRECSEFVHGNPNALIQIPEHLDYKKELMEMWCEKALVMKRVMFFVFALRYLPDMNEENKRRIADIINDEFATIKPLRDLF